MTRPRWCSNGHGTSSRRCSKPRKPTSSCSTTVGWAWPAAPPPRSLGARSPSAAFTDHGGGDLAAEIDFNSDGSFPFGCHIAVVEVDTETGAVELLRHFAVDDCGRVLNPMLAEAQVHGGIAQGVAQALFERVVYDDDGNPLTASLLDYAVPSAAELPSFSVFHTETPTPRNPLGAKGIGESGTTGSTAAVWNAVVDALQPVRRAPPRHAVHARTGLARHPSRRARPGSCDIRRPERS